MTKGRISNDDLTVTRLECLVFTLHLTCARSILGFHSKRHAHLLRNTSLSLKVTGYDAAQNVKAEGSDSQAPVKHELEDRENAGSGQCFRNYNSIQTVDRTI